MSMEIRPLKLTYEDYLYLPEDGKRHEIIDGDHYATATPDLKHQSVVGNLASALLGFTRLSRLGQIWMGPVDVVLSDYDVVEPDLVFLGRDRMDLAANGANIQGAPDLIVEVFSPATRRTDAITKRNLYQKFGVQEYWLVDPELEIIQVYRMTEGFFRREAELSAEQGEILTSPLFPGLEIALQDVFE